MSAMLGLPPEIILLIFENLHDLDDLVRLATACKQLNSLYKPHKSKLLWNLIRKSDHHKYDTALCELHDAMHGTEDCASLNPLFQSQPPPDWIFEDYLNLKSVPQPRTNEANNTDNTDRHLRYILSWWQQAGWLCSIYAKKMDEYLSVLPFMDMEPMNLDLQTQYLMALHLDQKGGLTGKICDPLCSNPSTHAAEKSTLYRAVMRRFLDTKALQFARFCQKPEYFAKFNNDVWDIWSTQPNCTLQESFEMLEIFDFTSNFMLLHILGSPDNLSTWSRLGREHDDVAAQDIIEDLDDTWLKNWIGLLFRLQPYLTPFDILSLFRKEKLEYDSLKIILTILSNEGNNENIPGMSEILNSTAQKLKEDFKVPAQAWRFYRHHSWRRDIRGQILRENFEYNEMIKGIARSKDPGRHWWERLTEDTTRVHDSGVEVSVPREFVSNFTVGAVGDEGEDDDDMAYYYADGCEHGRGTCYTS